jgi:hypothetical protein
MTTRKQPIPGIAVSSHIVTPTRIPRFSFNCASVLAAEEASINPNGVGSATAPASDFAAGRIVWQTEGFSLMKLIPCANRDGGGNTITGLKMRVYGWSRDASLTSTGGTSPSLRLWWPTMLFAADMTRAASGWTPWSNTDQVNAAWGLMSTIVKAFGDGKIFNAPTDNHGGACVVIDTLGCQFVDVRFFCTSYTGTNVANVIWHSL